MDSINNLNNTRTYLVGAMDRVVDGGVNWRDEITPKLKNLGIKVIDPCKKLINQSTEEYSRYWIEYYKETEQYDKIRKKFSIIRTSDLRCVDVSDFIIAHIDISVHACGSYEEITTANRQKKPILIWCKQGKKNAPNWLFFMLPHEHIFGSMDEIIEYLLFINSLEDTSRIKRWFFFSNL